ESEARVRGGRWTPPLVAGALQRAAKAAWEAAGEKGLPTEVEWGEREWKGEDLKIRDRRKDAEVEAVAPAAEQAGGRLQSRSVVREEAVAMLAEALPPLKMQEPLRALQLSALRGAVRLAAAIAPRAAGAGTRRRQGLRCRRCGSGEERMRRTRCASCGRSGC